MKIAVIGANGFIGRHVLSALNKRNIPCVAVDLLPPDETTMSLTQEWRQMDIHNPPVNLFEQTGCPDACIHLAWKGLGNYKSLHHFESELPAHFRLLSTLVRQGLHSLVVTGTCFEYGMRSGELCETMEAQPTNAYGFSKAALCRQLQFLREVTPYAFTWCRLFYLFGEGQSQRSLWGQLRQAVNRGDTRFPMSGGEQLRDYLPVEIVAEHLVSLAVAQADIGTVNICSGHPVSVRSLVEQWIASNGWQIKPELGCYPYPDYEPMAFWGSAAKLTNWLQSVNHRS